MKVGEKVVRVIDVRGSKTATIAEIESIERGRVRLKGSVFEYSLETRKELDGVLPGITSELVPFDADEPV
jgi:hypothetical protein